MIVAERKIISDNRSVLTYASGDRMKPNVHGEVYRVAFDSANAELNQILVSFEELKARKERIEKVVWLSSLFWGRPTNPAMTPCQARPPTPANPRKSPLINIRPRTAPPSDPFQQRIDQVLGQEQVRETLAEPTGSFRMTETQKTPEGLGASRSIGLTPFYCAVNQSRQSDRQALDHARTTPLQATARQVTRKLR